MRLIPHTIVTLLLICVLGCSRQPQANSVLRLAVTTSTRDTGLLERLVPEFEQANAARVDVIAVGTGKALKLGKAGDVDVMLVHAREAEDAFIDAGHGIRREDVMYNTFELLGPPQDPAGVQGMDVISAFQRIANQQQKFVSRGDDSGTHQREMRIWQAAGGLIRWSNYIEAGQGMGATLTIADQTQAYVLADRGTYLARRKSIGLVPLVIQIHELCNPYGIIVVNPAKSPFVNAELASDFVDFMVSPETQRRIADFRVDGESLFHPLRLVDQASE